MQQIIAALDTEIGYIRAVFLKSLDMHGTWVGYTH